MTIPVFGLQAIKDKATRDAIYQLAQRAGTGDSTGGVAVEVQADDPVSEPGTEGDIIYATGSESIWVFVGTSWERATSGTFGTVVSVRVAMDPGSGTAYSTWNARPNSFRNNMGTSRALVVDITEGNTQLTDAQMMLTSAGGRVNSFTWYRNGSAFTADTSIQRSGVTGDGHRAIIIDATDVTDNQEDAFTCTVNFD